ncbi:MAG TPA: glycerophosphodiester phosphodiesterase [Polyangia bacterium]
MIGHRGASALAPENSREAFARAAADGADGVELDVLRCATGEVIVFHDDDLSRLGGRPERIAALSLAALREVRLTSGASIPTLEEALAACGEHLLVNVELKAAGVPWAEIRALVAAVASIVRAPGVRERVLVSSFHPYAVAAWQRCLPEVPAGLLFEAEASIQLRRAWALPWLRPFSVNPQDVLCDTEAVQRWHRRGYRVSVWTVDAPAELRRLAAAGVDAIITNDPARSRAILGG